MPDPQSLSARFGAVLRGQRLLAGWSLSEFAYRTDRDVIHLGLIERGARRASIEMAGELAAALGKSLSELIMEAERL
jgi:transcriptional regulator with XRE-family HTH domain